MTTIIFSKDRALQLDAFLRSYWHHVRPVEKVFVLVLATSDRHRRAYAEVFARHSWVIVVVQSRLFKSDVLQLVPSTGCVTFFVDDQIFLHTWDVIERPGLSLRLGLNLTYNYNSADAPQSLPLFQIDDDGFVSWLWGHGKLAWAYPLSVDGHVYDASELRTMLDRIDFHSPNTLEHNLQTFAPQFLPRHGYCYLESKVVNIPWTSVQSDWTNRNAGMSIDNFLSIWEDGHRIDVGLLYGVRNRSVHQEFPLMLERRLAPVKVAV